MTGLRRVGRGAWLAALVLLAGCALGPDKPDPRPLEAFAPRIAGSMAWNARLDKVSFPLVVAVHGTVFTVASDDGSIAAFDASNGATHWRATVEGGIAAGVGSDGRYSAVVTRGGEVVTLEAGQERWRAPVGTRVATPPLVAGERVFVLGVDRSVQAFDAADGRRLWRVYRPGDPLTLAQVGVLTTDRNLLVVGHGPRLTGLDPSQGAVQWEATLATPRGANEVERLAGLVGPAVRVGDRVCVRAFQAAVGCVAADQGTLAWTRSFGGIHGVAGDAEYVYAIDASDRLSAWRVGGGEPAWNSERFLYHGLSTPLSTGRALVFGDAKGFVQWLSRDQGEPLLRLPTDGTPVVAAPVVAGGTLLVVTRGGGVFAFRSE